jgi:class 3 adenylate cyclase
MDMTKPATILVADDARSVVELVREVLLLQGYQVVEAFDGLEALEKIQQHYPDLLILDIQMPRMDGYEVCRQLKDDPGTANIPVLMLSALESVDHQVRGLSLGAEDYIVKPFRTDELIARVEACLRTKRKVDALRLSEENVRATFQRYVAPKVVEKILSDPSAVSLGGTRRDVTILFADISGFTELSEQVGPERIMHLLNNFFTLAGQAVLDQEGTLDKFIGDAVMALFNAPLAQPDHAFRAVHAALAIQERVSALECADTPDHRLHCKIGIGSGDAVVGNTGMPDLMNYTAIGDAVNIAQRLEQSAQPDQILLSPATYDLVQREINARPLGPVRLKGRRTPVLIYELLGYRSPGQEEEIEQGHESTQSRQKVVEHTGVAVDAGRSLWDKR